MKAIESESLSLARGLLLNAAPRAAQTVVNGLDDDCSKEQLSAAQDILDRVGVRKDQPISQAAGSNEGIAIAYGAFRALFDAFGIKVALPETPAFQLPSIEEALEVEAVPIEESGAVAIAPKKAPSASQKKKQRPILKEGKTAERVRSRIKHQKAKAEKEFEIEL